MPLAGSGELPPGEFPATILHLLLPTGDRLPDGSANTWTSAETMHLLREYGVQEFSTSSGNASTSTVPAEGTRQAFEARGALARELGVSRAQVASVFGATGALPF